VVRQEKMLRSPVELLYHVMYVFDTSVLVAALRSRKGASFLLLRALRDGEIKGMASTALLLEYADVLKRDANLKGCWLAC
jgi:predicted nucleic acid-binding protein